MDARICAAVWTSRGARQLMELLAYDIGPRPPGSEAMRRASAAVCDVLETAGAARVHTEPVPVLAWTPGVCRLESVAPRRRPYECVQHVHSAAAQCTAPLVADTGQGRLDGAVAILGGHESSGSRFVPLQIRVEELRQRGAAAVLVRNLIPGTGPAIELMGVERDVAIPVLGISWEDAGELSAVARSGNASVHLEAAGTTSPAECVNTIADLGPQSDDVEMILLSAHMDTFHVNGGAFDNLTGVVTLLEMAKALAPLQERFVRRLRLVVYTGEEYGFIGSRAYVDAHRGELDRVRFVFNLDSLWPATADGIAVMWSPEMAEYLSAALAETPRTADVRNLFCMSSDYLPFLLEGIPCARPAGFEAAFPPYSHTRMDTPDKVPSDWIRLNAMTHAQMLARLLTDPQPLPARRKTPDEVAALLDAENARELLRVYGFPV